ncbi:MAG: roadblock/LC7 domain-containing protein [Candidatus Hodarchaeota archaeon]
MVNLREEVINNVLKEFRERTGITSTSLFTEDGFLIAVEGANSNKDEDFFQSIAAICAGVISLAENGVEIKKDRNFIRKIIIQAGNQLDNDGFMIILETVTNDILISVLFPIYLNLGVVLFELNHVNYKLSEYFSILEQNENLERLTSLL